MAFYADTTSVKKTTSPVQYGLVRNIGEKPGGPGIYKCQRCGFEDVINRECTKLPPCAHCSSSNKEANTWKFLVKATDQ